MNQNSLSQRQIIRNVSYLMLIFLILSIFANTYLQRYSFVIIYIIGLSILLFHFYMFKKTQDNNKAANMLMLFLYAVFFTFFFIGEQETFDILWILVLPTVAIIISSYLLLKTFLSVYLISIILIITLNEFNEELIKYESFALFSLLWASIFLSGMSLYYKKTQLSLEKEIYKYQNNLELKISQATSKIHCLNKDLESTQYEIIQRLGTLAEYRSEETGAHVTRVGLYSKHLALLYGFSKKDANILLKAAPLHDIGKVGIEDSILHKNAKLSKEEFEIMKNHTLIGENVLKNSNKPLLQIASLIAGAHHEKYDGSGYPRALKENQIPIEARIVSIADVFDALISKRSYKQAWSEEKINEYFLQQRAKHFDPHLVDLFLENFQDFIKIHRKNCD